MDAFDKLREAFERAGIDPKELDKLLESLRAGDDGAGETLEKLGEMLGRFARGAAGGAGVPIDPELLRLLLELLGPLAKDGFERILEQFFGGPGYDVTTPEPFKWSRMRRKPRRTLDVVDDEAPDVSLEGRFDAACEKDAGIRIQFRVVVAVREEKIAFVRANAYGAEGSGVIGSTSRHAGQTGSPIPQPSSQTDDGRYEVQLELFVPCAEAVKCGGNIQMLVFVEDEDGNQTWLRLSTQVADVILEGECCKHFREGELAEIFRRIFEKGNPDRGRLDGALDRFFDGEKPAPKAPTER